jgi:hypothetical protein
MTMVGGDLLFSTHAYASDLCAGQLCAEKGVKLAIAFPFETPLDHAIALATPRSRRSLAAGECFAADAIAGEATTRTIASASTRSP